MAKDPVLDMRERGNLNEIFVAPGRELDHNYTLMTEHVCPVGALTSKDFRFKARVWFLRSATSVCQGCATGCNAHLDFDPRYNKVVSLPPARERGGQQVLDVRRGHALVPRRHEGRVLDARVGEGREDDDRIAAIAEVSKRLGDDPARRIAWSFSARSTRSRTTWRSASSPRLARRERRST